MKKLVILMTVAVATLTSCANSRTINGITYKPYGLFNAETVKCDSIIYEPSLAATISGVIFFELVVPPIYVFGYSFYEPIMSKSDFRNMKAGK